MTGKAYSVRVDTAGCTLCDVCSERCPVGALVLRREQATLTLLFHPTLCDGCQGEPACQALCPEKVVQVVVDTERAQGAEPVLLVQGKMAQCRSCGRLFAPERKVARLVAEGKVQPSPVHGLCPACRREGLIDSYLSGVARSKPSSS